MNDDELDERLSRIEQDLERIDQHFDRLELIGRCAAELGLSVVPEIDPQHPAHGSAHVQARLQRMVPNTAKVVALYASKERRGTIEKLLADRDRSRREALNAPVVDRHAVLREQNDAAREAAFARVAEERDAAMRERMIEVARVAEERESATRKRAIEVGGKS
jgi:hypothetical protein